MDVLNRAKFPPPVARADVAADWRSRGYDCRPFVDPPGQRWEGFRHGTNELLTVVDGVLECVLDGETVRVNPGDELFIPRGVVHSVRNVHRGTTRWLFGYD